MEWNVEEAATSFPEGFPVERLPNSLPSQIKVVKSNGHIGFQVGNVVGTVPLGAGNSLRIWPKYKGINIVEMMLYVQGVDNKLKNADLARQYGFSDGLTRSELFVRAFVEQLRVIEESSLKFDRRKEPMKANHAKGSVNWAKTSLNRKRGIENPVITKVQVPTYDIPENLLLGAAAKKCLFHVKRFSPEWTTLQRWAHRFGGFSPRELFRALDRKLLQDRIGGARAYYSNAIVTAKLILGYYGMDTGEYIEGDALLVNTPALYEEFVRVGCQNVLRSKGVFVSKGFVPVEFLFNDGSCEVIPDIVFSKGSALVVVGDVKYKEPDSKDYYQMYTYIKRARLRTGIIFSPCKNGESTPVLKSRRAFDGIEVVDVQIPVGGAKDLENTIKDIFEGRVMRL